MFAVAVGEGKFNSLRLFVMKENTTNDNYKYKCIKLIHFKSAFL